jgi:hypothetical protein
MGEIFQAYLITFGWAIVGSIGKCPKTVGVILGLSQTTHQNSKDGP